MMIAMLGKLERVTEPRSPMAAAESPSLSSNVNAKVMDFDSFPTDRSSVGSMRETPVGTGAWKWSGYWAFGETVPTGPDGPGPMTNASAAAAVRLPFFYTWQSLMLPEDIRVPSATQTRQSNCSPQENNDSVSRNNEHMHSTDQDNAHGTTDQSKESDAPETRTESKDSETPNEAQLSIGFDANSKSDDPAQNASTPVATHRKTGKDTLLKSGIRPITFANIDYQGPNPGDLSFTDACWLHPNQCPPSGLFQGFFETAATLARRHSNSPATIQIPETCNVFFNATPPPQVPILFPNESHRAVVASESDRAIARLPSEGHVLIRGCGENQYGGFELLGSLELATGITVLRKMYVVSPLGSNLSLAPSRITTRTRSRNRSVSSGIASIGSSAADDSDVRPTRKRQLSWKRRAVCQDQDGKETTQQQTPDDDVTTVAQSGRGVGRKKVRIDMSIFNDGNVEDGITPPKANEGPTIALPQPGAVHSSGKRPQASPRSVSSCSQGTVATSTVMPATTLSGSGPRRRAGSASAVPALGIASKIDEQVTSSTSVGAVATAPGPVGGGPPTLPPDGEPMNARWRAAHFLYYHRNDPTLASDTNNNNTNANANTGAPSQGAAIANGAMSSNNSQASTNVNIKSAAASTATPKYVVYEGEMLNCQRDGKGVCLFSNNLMYEGSWKRDKEQGYGTLMTADRKRIIYKGEWERGRMHGHGIYYYHHQNFGAGAGGGSNEGTKEHKHRKDGIVSRYEGEFRENLRHGTGTYILPDGSTYAGIWRDGMMSGRGVFTWNDGSIYDGEWKDSKRHGQGLLIAADGFRYDGTWVYNSMEGRGSAIYPNGQEYHGLFSNGRREGRGTIVFTNGARYEGRFRDDAVDGQGTMKMSETILVPRNPLDGEGGSNEEGDDDDDVDDGREDFMIPVFFQSDMGHIHRKAGFTIGGE